jgi:hypothetical protein
LALTGTTWVTALGDLDGLSDSGSIAARRRPSAFAVLRLPGLNHSEDGPGEHRRFSFITGNWRRLNIQHLSKSL